MTGATLHQTEGRHLGTDAHALNQFDFMQFGVAVDRRYSRENILNTVSWEGIEHFKHYRQRA